MPTARLPAAAGLAFWTALAMPVAAQDHVATLRGSVDGAAQSWHVVALAGETGSYWADMGTLHLATVFAYPVRDASRVEGAMEIGLTLDSRSAPMAPVAARVLHYADGMRSPYAVPPGGDDGVEVTLEVAEIVEGQLHLVGRLQADLTRMSDPLTESFDAEDTLTLSVAFDLRLDPL